MNEEKEVRAFGSKRAKVNYQMEHPPKVCKTCLRSLSLLEKSEGVFVEWCFYCQSELPLEGR